MKRYLIFILALTAMVAMGCSKKKSNGGVAPPYVEIPAGGGPFIPGGTGPGQGPGSNLEFGGTATLDIVSLSVMTDYTGRPMNDPQDIKINVNLVDTGNGAYGGVVTVAYKEDGVNHEGYFASGDTSSEARYNRWVTIGSQYAWHGFFEDFLGGVIVVIDDVVDLGDGNGPEDKIGGSIWFKNFGLEFSNHPPTRCWFVSIGPYDCRAWRNDGDIDNPVNTNAAVYPDNGYTKLGEFIDMSYVEAFNE